MSVTRHLRRWLTSVALRCAPASYRRRFGNEILADLDESSDSAMAFIRNVLELSRTGVAERFSAGRRALNGRHGRRHVYDFDLGRLDALALDMRYAVRRFRSAPMAAALTVVTLGLGSGVTAAVYSAVDATFLRPLPFPAPDGLVHIDAVPVPIDLGDYRRTEGEDHPPVRPLDFRDVAAMRDVFERTAAFATGSMNLGGGPEPRRVAVSFVTGDFFTLLGRRARLGRTFDDAVQGGPVAVLSARLWRREFNADPSLIGRTVQLNGRATVVIGVMPDDFGFPSDTDVWAPLSVPVPLDLIGEAFRNFLPSLVLGRLAPGVTAAHASQRVDAARATATHNATPASSAREATSTPAVQPLQRWLAGDQRTTLWALLASAFTVLLVACINAGTLLLARATSRRHAMALEMALGATRARLIRGLLLEGLVLAVAGCIAGFFAATVAMSLVEAQIPSRVSGVAPMRLDYRVVLVTSAASALTTLLCCLWPALTGTAVAPSRTAIADGQRSVTASSRISRRMVVAQTAAACVLVLVAGVLLGSLHALLSADVGLRSDGVTTGRVTLPPARYPSRESLGQFVEQTLARLTGMPGVAAAAAVNTLPMAREPHIVLRIGAADSVRHAGESFVGAPYLVVSPGYFATIGTRLLAGREFTWQDGVGTPVAIVNRVVARRFWPGTQALGRQVTYAGQTRTVIGVVDDVRVTDLGLEPPPQVYLPIQEHPQHYVSFVVLGHTAVGTDALVRRLAESVHGVDSGLPVHAAMAMDALIAETVAPQRANALLVSTFALIAFTLAVTGVYGILSYATVSRTREIGVRMALGATPASIRIAVILDALRLTFSGVGIGLSTALVLSRHVAALLPAGKDIDASTVLAVIVLFAGAAAIAAYIPARRASAISAVDAIRAE